jgi:hypothetical protein
MANKHYIATYATERYTYALPNFGRRIAASIIDSGIKKGVFLFVCDEKEKTKDFAHKYIESVLPKGWIFKLMPIAVNDKEVKNYKEDAQLLIAQLQSCAFTEARKNNAKSFFSVESDVLVQPNSYRVAMDCIKFDNGYYDIAMCSYPSQGGGPFLGGRGTKNAQIANDVYEDEKDIPKELLKKKKILDSKIEKIQKKWESDKDHIAAQKSREELKDEEENIEKEIKECPPKGNVYELNAVKWRKRGWMEYAYPAIGKGAVVPTDWVGLGCTLLSRKALSLSHFDGYMGFGTQDLYLGWTRWKQANLNMCVTTHSVCDHVIRKRGKDGNQVWEDFVIVNSFHEEDGEYVGHLRQQHSKMYNFTAGEKPKIFKDEKPKEPEDEKG